MHCRDGEQQRLFEPPSFPAEGCHRKYCAWPSLAHFPRIPVRPAWPRPLHRHKGLPLCPRACGCASNRWLPGLASGRITCGSPSLLAFSTVGAKSCGLAHSGSAGFEGRMGVAGAAGACARMRSICSLKFSPRALRPMTCPPRRESCSIWLARRPAATVERHITTCGSIFLKTIPDSP